MSPTENMYSKLNIRLRDGINCHLNRLKWNLKTLSEKSSISYETLKKLANAKIDNPSLISTFKIACAFNITPENLLDIDSSISSTIMPCLEKHSTQFIRALIKLEYACQNLNMINDGCCHVPLFEPSGYLYDKTKYVSWNFSIIDIGHYVKLDKDDISFAIKVTSQNLMPYFTLDDILLISTDNVPAGKICLIINNGIIYIRKYVISPCKKYIPITPTSSKREFYPDDDIVIMGYITKVITP